MVNAILYISILLCFSQISPLILSAVLDTIFGEKYRETAMCSEKYNEKHRRNEGIMYV